ncbi:hypothetical protein BD414DRAFT_549915 [Trametes punicea]|nr:hypothetical protein BD414DRAFT_549915 [Trametes punicea]
MARTFAERHILLLKALLPLLLLPLHVIHPAVARAVNRTIDDELGDSVTGLKPVYSPATSWHQGASCTTCNIRPGLVNTARVFGGTWHDSTAYPGDAPHTVSLTFEGTAVYVFNLVANAVPRTATLANLTFCLDGEPVGEFVHVPDGTSDVLYNVLVYANASLPNTRTRYPSR